MPLLAERHNRNCPQRPLTYTKNSSGLQHQTLPFYCQTIWGHCCTVLFMIIENLQGIRGKEMNTCLSKNGCGCYSSRNQVMLSRSVITWPGVTQSLHFQCLHLQNVIISFVWGFTKLAGKAHDSLQSCSAFFSPLLSLIGLFLAEITVSAVGAILNGKEELVDGFTGLSA